MKNKTSKELKNIEDDINNRISEIYGTQKITKGLTAMLLIISILLCFSGMKQQVKIIEQNQQINAMTELIDNLKGEKNV